MYLRSSMWLISSRAMIYPPSTPRPTLLFPPMYVISYIMALLSLIYTKGASLGEMKRLSRDLAWTPGSFLCGMRASFITW